MTIGIILLVFFAIPVVFLGILNSGNLAGIILSVLIILCSIYSGKIHSAIQKLCRLSYGKIITAIVVLICGTVALFTVISSVLIISRFQNPPAADTTVVVLGCKVNPNGPSLLLKNRIDAAYRFLEDNPDIKCIVSGGKGNDEPISEARCMYDHLAKMGIDEDRIYIENESKTTRENIEFSKKIIDKEGLCKDITIITNDFHQYRASRIATKMGITSYNVSGRTPISMFPTYFLREIGGILYELVF